MVITTCLIVVFILIHYHKKHLLLQILFVELTADCGENCTNCVLEFEKHLKNPGNQTCMILKATYQGIVYCEFTVSDVYYKIGQWAQRCHSTPRGLNLISPSSRLFVISADLNHFCATWGQILIMIQWQTGNPVYTTKIMNKTTRKNIEYTNLFSCEGLWECHYPSCHKQVCEITF